MLHPLTKLALLCTLLLTLIASSQAAAPAQAQTGTIDLIGSYDTPGLAKGVYVSGNYAYVADDNYGLKQYLRQTVLAKRGKMWQHGFQSK